MDETNGSYRFVLDQYRAVRHLDEVLSLLDWDRKVTMPQAGAEFRTEQLSLVAALRHQKLTDERFVAAVMELAGRNDLSAEQQIVIREIKREVSHAVAVPSTLIEAIALAEGESHSRWLEARRENRFGIAAPALEKLLNLKKSFADCLSGGKRLRYDALLDLYEVGAETESIRTLFDSVKPELKEIAERYSGQPETLHGRISAEAQLAVCERVVSAIGFQRERGRLDPTVHPFCTRISANDIRLTTRFKEENFLSALYAAVHEAGHGLYDQGFDLRFLYTPLAEDRSLGVHESQSLFWEKAIGRSMAFCQFLAPLLSEVAPEDARLSPEALYRAVNYIRPTLIRVDADEVTYGLHIIARFELEQALVAGDLAVGDLGFAWNEKYKQLLGLDVPDDLRGVLQDIHWYSGDFGYFPTYLLGSMYASQLCRAAASELGDLDRLVTRGEFAPILDWLRKKVHLQGKRFESGAKLIEFATGSPSSADALIGRFRRKHLEGATSIV